MYASTIGVTVAALEWGKDHDSDARRYQESLESGYRVELCGLFVHDNGYLGASPDG